MGLFSSIKKGLGSITPNSWLSAGLGVAGGLFQANQANSAAAQANAWNVENFKNRYQWSMEDMKKAGLNPILAATQGIGGSVNGASAAGISGTDFGASTIAAGSQANSAKKMADLAASKTGAEIELLRAEASNQSSSASLNRLNTTFLQNTLQRRMEKLDLEVENLRKEGKSIDADTYEKMFRTKVVMPAMAQMYIAQSIQSSSAAGLYSSQRRFQDIKNRRADNGAGSNPWEIGSNILSDLWDKGKDYIGHYNMEVD